MKRVSDVSLLISQPELALSNHLKDYLEVFGLSYVESTDIEKTISEVQKNQAIEIIVNDVSQNPGHAELLLEEIRSFTDRNLRLVIAGTLEQNEIQKYYSLGASGFLQKPYRSKEFLETLRAARPTPNHFWSIYQQTQNQFLFDIEVEDWRGPYDSQLRFGIGGVCFHSDQIGVRVGTLVRCKILFNKNFIQGTGRVRWRLPHGANEYSYGVELIDLSEKSQATFQQVLEKHPTYSFIPCFTQSSISIAS